MFLVCARRRARVVRREQRCALRVLNEGPRFEYGRDHPLPAHALHTRHACDRALDRPRWGGARWGTRVPPARAAPLEVAQRQAAQARAVQVVEDAEDDRLRVPVLKLRRLLRAL